MIAWRDGAAILDTDSLFDFKSGGVQKCFDIPEVFKGGPAHRLILPKQFETVTESRSGLWKRYSVILQPPENCFGVAVIGPNNVRAVLPGIEFHHQTTVGPD